MQPSDELAKSKDEVTLAYALLQSSLESLKDVMIFSIDRNYGYLHFNKAFKEATGYAYGTEVAKGISMLDTITDASEKAKAKQNCDRALQGESHTTVEVYGTLNPSYFETTYSPIINDKQEVIGVTILSADVTSRKTAEEQIKALNKELEAFSYSVAHDLRAPLRAISGFSGILVDEHLENLNAECQKIITVISGNVKRMNQLIDDLLDFSRLGRAALSNDAIDMQELIGSVLEEQATTIAAAGTDVRLGTLMQIKGDRNLMHHAMTNLISNALKYSRKQDKPVVEIISWQEGNAITYSVKDNGAGFDMKYADKLFGVFQRLHKASEFEGTGVGLATVKRIITRHGGTIRAEAEVNKGATFYFTMPAV